MHSKDSVLSKCKIKKISEINNDKLFTFYKKIYPNRFKSLTSNWKWWYRVDKTFAEPIILELDDKVIGQAAFLKNNIIIEGKKIPAIWFQDYAVLPEFMGLGLGKLLTKEWMKICPNQMAMCSPYSLRVLKKFGWSFNFETKRLIRPINYLNILPVVNKLNLNLFNSTVRYFLKRKFNDEENIKLFKLSNNFKVISDSFELRKPSDNSNYFPMIDRDKNWLNWRLVECPYNQNIYFFEYKNSFSIVHIYSIDKIKRLNVLFTYSTEKTDELKLYKLMVKWAIDNKIDFIWAIHKIQNFNYVFPKIYNRPLNFACWSDNPSIFEILRNGFFDLQGIDSDIESALFVE